MNSSSASQGSDSNSSSLTSPVSVIPLFISIATLVAIVVAACVIYRKRQRRRAQELARRLRVTERRIDSLKARKERAQELSAGKTDYFPPTDLQNSISSLDIEGSIRKQPSHQLPSHYALHAQEEPFTRSTTTIDSTRRSLKHQEEVTINSVVCSVYEETSFDCSTCKEEGSMVTDSQTTNEGINSSMAVECETTPSVSSMSTLQERVPRKSHYSARLKLPRQYNGGRYPPTVATSSTPSVQSASNVGTWGSITSTLHPSPYPHMGISPLWEDITMATGEEGRPNTPVSSTIASSITHTEGSDGHTSDGQKEKWV